MHVYNHALAPCDVDPLDVAASIVAVLQLSARVLAYLNDIKDDSRLYNLLTSLRFRLEGGGSSQ
jgi:hypothetical protein